MKIISNSTTAGFYELPKSRCRVRVGVKFAVSNQFGLDEKIVWHMCWRI